MTRLPLPDVVWRSNVVTSTVHLVEGGSPLCGMQEIILAEEDEGGIACGHCLRIYHWRSVPLPPRREALGA